jgi:hypothetical protein
MLPQLSSVEGTKIYFFCFHQAADDWLRACALAKVQHRVSANPRRAVLRLAAWRRIFWLPELRVTVPQNQHGYRQRNAITREERDVSRSVVTHSLSGKASRQSYRTYDGYAHGKKCRY